MNVHDICQFFDRFERAKTENQIKTVDIWYMGESGFQCNGEIPSLLHELLYSAGTLAYAHILARPRSHQPRFASHVDNAFSDLRSMGEQHDQHGMFTCSAVLLACI